MSRHTPAMDASLIALQQRLQSLSVDCAALTKPKMLADLSVARVACEGVRDAACELRDVMRDVMVLLRAEMGITDASSEGVMEAGKGVGARQEGTEERATKRRRTEAPKQGQDVVMADADNQTPPGPKARTYLTAKQIRAQLTAAAGEFKAQAAGLPQLLHEDFTRRHLLDILEIMEREVQERGGKLGEMVRGMPMSVQGSGGEEKEEEVEESVGCVEVSWVGGGKEGGDGAKA